MPALALAFSIGVFAVLMLPALPPAAWAWCGLPALAALPAPSPWRWLAAAVLGCCYAWGGAAHELAERLPDGLDGRSFVVTGSIDSLPEAGRRRARFDFSVESLYSQGRPVAGPDRLRLSWYDDAPALHAGQRWCLGVKLRVPHGYANPGGFDYERWLFGEGIDATGYVSSKVAPRRLADAGHWLTRWRERLSARLEARAGAGEASALVRALVVGDRRGLDDRMWSVLNATGTGHLVAISGLHIGLLAALGMLVGRSLGRRLPCLVARRPALHWGALLAVGFALTYAALAGFALPTRRALVMVVTVLGAIWLRREVRPRSALCAALLAVLLLDPLAPLGAGFWLSFMAVTALVFAFGGARRRRLLEASRAQLIVGLALLPALVPAIGRVAWVAPLANLFAIPLVGMAAVPLSLTGAALLAVPGPPAGWVLGGAGWLLTGFWAAASWLAAWPALTSAVQAPGPWTLAAALAGTAWLLAPRGLPARWLGVVLLAPMLWPGGAAPGPGGFRLAVLDVGQGLAAVVRTHRHVLVYDTGPRFRSGFNTARAVVAPYLRATGVRRLDAMVISHGDSDHAGGAGWLAQRFRPSLWLSGAPDLDPDAGPCRDGQRWRWDGVEFRMLHPPPGMPYLGNASSCVLRVDGGGGTVLLTGDVTRLAERRLVAVYGDRLHADVLVAPHHGSASSSSRAFIQAVAPRRVVFATGWHNRFHLPAIQVSDRYRSASAGVLNTACLGMVRFTFRPGSATARVSAWRREHVHFWTHRPAACGPEGF